MELSRFGVYFIYDFLLVYVAPVHRVEDLHDGQDPVPRGPDDPLLAHVDQFLAIGVPPRLPVHGSVHIVVGQIGPGLQRQHGLLHVSQTAFWYFTL